MAVSISSITSPIMKPIKALYNEIPSMEIAKNSVLNGVEYIGRKWTSPQQRVAMGVTALALQPLIDYRNRHVDEKTRDVSVSRTIAKICVGTATGFLIRYGCIKAIKNCSKSFGEISHDASAFKRRLQTFFTPNNIDPKNEDAISQYRNAMGTIISLLVMSFTNFAVDAPLTKLMTNGLIKARMQSKEAPPIQEKGVDK
jgi:hypothetical protein